MANQEPFVRKEMEDKFARKLHKREQRISERLEDAQAAYIRALERLQRAERRVQKRLARVQRLEGRLKVIHQQLEAFTINSYAADNVPVAQDDQQESSDVSLQLPDEAVQSIEWENEIQYPDIVEDAQPIESQEDQIVDEMQIDEMQIIEDGLEISPVEFYHVEDEIEHMEDVGGGGPEYAENEGHLVEVPLESEQEKTEKDEQQRHQEDSLRESELLIEPSTVEGQEVEKLPTETEEPPVIAIVAEGTGAAEAIRMARENRAVAEAAEKAVRIAVKRAQAIAIYLEQVSSARHLTLELELLETEVERASIVAREAQEAAQEAERIASELQGEAGGQEASLEMGPAVSEIGRENQEESPLEPETRDVENEVELEFEEEWEIESGEERDEAEEEWEVLGEEELDEAEEEGELKSEGEEAFVESIAAMTIADAAGAAAAEAEALAEASSMYTRQVRQLAYNADQALIQIRIAISTGSLIGEAAENALQAAERDATHAHAVLADAEAREEQALQTAMNAEAEAEVAEGMARAANERYSLIENHREEVGPEKGSEGEQSENEGPGEKKADEPVVFEDDEEDTLEMPVVQRKEFA